MTWIAVLLALAALIVALLSFRVARRNAGALERLQRAPRMPLGVVEVKLDSDQIVEKLRQFLDDEDGPGEEWKRRQ